MWTAFAKNFVSNIRRMFPFHAFVLAHAAIVLGIAASQGRVSLMAYGDYIDRFGPLYFAVLPVVLAATRACLVIVRNRRVAASDFELDLPVLFGQLASSAVTLGMIVLFMGSFTTFKTLMPMLMGGFPYDRILADIDVHLHGGVEPGQVLASLFSHPLVLKALQWNYTVPWMALTFVPIFFVAIDAPHLRLRYCLTFVLVWAILGNLLACLFLSAGPIFYVDITGDAARFDAVKQILDGTLGSTFHRYLWQAFAEGTVGLGTGISAFPSLHVAAAMMNALFLRDLNRIAGLAGFAYVAVILVSSVLLGWHYAVDGYASILVVWLLHGALKRVFEGEENPSSEDALTPSPSPATP